MGHILNNLAKEEKIVYHTGLSAVIFMPCLFLAFLVVIAYLGTHGMPFSNPLVKGIWLLCFLKTLCSILTFFTSEFGITNRRVLGKTGYIQVESLDILLNKVEAIRVNSSLLGRLIGFGDIEVTGTGGTHEVLQNIPNPLYFRRILQEQLDAENAMARTIARSQAHLRVA